MSNETWILGSGEDMPFDFVDEVLDVIDTPNEGDVLEEFLVYKDEDEDEDEKTLGAGADEPSFTILAQADDSDEDVIMDPAAARRLFESLHDGAGPSGLVELMSTGAAATVDPENVDTLVERRDRERTAEGDDWTPDRVIGVRMAERTVRDVRGDEAIGGAQGRGHPSARGRGRPRGRGRDGRGAARGSRSKNEWEKGDRLIEIYPDDEDVPPAFRETMESLVRKRVAGQEVRREMVKRKEQERREQERRERSRSVHGRGVNVDVGDDDGINADNDDDLNDDLPAYQDFIRFCQDEEATDFKWEPMKTFRGGQERFLVEQVGPTQPHVNGYEAFRSIWTDDLLKNIASETNRYASTIPQTERGFHQEWYATNAHEILILFAFWMMLGIIQMPTIAACFSLHPILKTDVFRKLLSQKRYWALNRALHFANVMDGDSDKLRLIRPIIDHLNSKFQELYVPAEQICIDESLTLWKGKLSFRQYIKTKAAKFGIKTYELCESSTGYLWSFFVYTGKDDSKVTSVQKCSLQVLKLIWPLLGKGYKLFMDNYFNSPLLARFLKRRKTDVVGTLRNGRSDVPRLISNIKVKEGQFVARHAGDVVVGSFQDKKPVKVISTYHNMDQSETVPKPGRPSQYKLNLVKDYNSGMGGIDQKDAMLQARLVERKQCAKWYKKLFKRLLNISVHNSRIIVEKNSGAKYDNLKFRIDLVGDIINHHLKHKPQQTQHGVNEVVFSRRGLDPARFICRPNEFHAIVKYLREPENAESARTSLTSKASVNRRLCVFCRPKGSSTVYECNICKVPLCLGSCFIKYHTGGS